LLINPHEIDGVATALKHALEMTAEERRVRHAPMLDYLMENDIKNWADGYLSTLNENSQGLGLLSGIRAFFAGSPEQRPSLVREAAASRN
jgi:trehalose-6-phosphate synthase